MQIKDILSWINTVAPFEYAEQWDNVGLQVGDPEASVRKVLCALDPATPSILEASKQGCQCLIVHHPLILEGLRSLNARGYPQRLVFELIRRNVNLIVAHTNLDASSYGGNRLIAEFLEIENPRSLDANPKFAEHPNYVGIGLVGKLVKPYSLAELSSRLCQFLRIPSAQVVGNSDRVVNIVAVCTGSGGTLLKKVLACGADCFVTGELKYHDAVWAKESGLSVVSLSHFHSEKFMMKWFAENLRTWSLEVNDPIEVFWFEKEEDATAVHLAKGVE